MALRSTMATSGGAALSGGLGGGGRRNGPEARRVAGGLKCAYRRGLEISAAPRLRGRVGPGPQRALGGMVHGRGRGPLGRDAMDAKIIRLERELTDIKAVSCGAKGPARSTATAPRGGGGAVAPPSTPGGQRKDRFNSFCPSWPCQCG